MSYFNRLVGNDALRCRLGAELSAGSLAHAYIIEGASGSGKHTLAREIAKAAACLSAKKDNTHFPCNTCRHCRKIDAGLCPDVITVSRAEDRATMGVEVVRALREGIATVPNDLDVKVYIIEDAHTMTTQAQNALLLTLEEPPSFVLFLLLTEDADALLETVRSRAPVFRMQPITRDTMRDYLQNDPTAKAAGAQALLSSSPEEFEELLLLADGRIGTALTLLDAKKRAPLIEKRHTVLEVVLALTDTASKDRLFFAVRALEQKREDVKLLLSMLKLALRDLVAISATESAPLLFFTDTQRALEISDRLSIQKLLRYVAAIEEASESLLANANINLTMTRLLSRLLDIGERA